MVFTICREKFLTNPYLPNQNCCFKSFSFAANGKKTDVNKNKHSFTWVTYVVQLVLSDSRACPIY